MASECCLWNKTCGKHESNSHDCSRHLLCMKQSGSRVQTLISAVNRMIPVMVCSHHVWTCEGLNPWVPQGKVTFTPVCPLEYAAHVLITKLQDICCKENRCKHYHHYYYIRLFNYMFDSQAGVFDDSRTRARAVEDGFCVSVKLVSEDGAVVHVACVD